MKRLYVTAIARADLESIRRYSLRTWGQEQTAKYMDTLRDTLKGVGRSTVTIRSRDDIRPGVQMATSGRHSIFFEVDATRVLVIRVLHDRMDYHRHLGPGGVRGEDR